MRRHQFLVKKIIHENKNTKIKMKTKTCLECGAELNSAEEIIFHDCDRKIKNN
jgi:hypothetical protein